MISVKAPVPILIFNSRNVMGPRAPDNPRRPEMTLDRAVLAFAGAMVLLSVVLTVYVSPLWMWFTVFIGANLIQSAFTGFCPAATVFRWLGVKAGTAFG
jgi:Flp pilus assembly protein TadB